MNPTKQSNTSSSVQLSADRQEQARRYARLKRYLLLADLGLGAAYLIVALLSGFSAWLGTRAQALAPAPAGTVAVYTVAFFGVYLLLAMPLNFVGGYVWPHRFGLSTQSLGAWAWDQVKGLLLGAALVLIFMEVLYALLRASSDWWWLWMGLFYLLFVVLMANLAPIILLPIFYKLVPLADTDLVARLTELARRANARVNGVYTMNLSAKTTAANAALMGLGNTRRIVLGDTLLKDYSADEIETVLAHELGHHVHGDVGKGILTETVLMLGGLWLASLVLDQATATLGFQGLADVAALPVLGLVLGAFLLVVMPLTNTYSRWRERMADRYALEMTHNPNAFASAMTRLANQNLAEADPPRWVEIMLYSHPAISRRLAMAHAFEAAGKPD